MATNPRLQPVTVSQVEKYLSPTLFAGTKETKSKAAYLGKIVKNMGNMVLNKFYRFAALVGQGKWINNKAVMGRLENKFKDLKSALESTKSGTPSLNIWERGLIHTGIKEMQAICKILSQSGANKKAIKSLEKDLNQLETTNLAGARRTIETEKTTRERDLKARKERESAPDAFTGTRQRLEKALTEQEICQKTREFDRKYPPSPLKQSRDADADRVKRAADRDSATLYTYELLGELEVIPEKELELKHLAKAGFDARRQTIYNELHALIEKAFHTPQFHLSVTPLGRLERNIQQATSIDEIKGYVKEAINLIKQGFKKKSLPPDFISEFKSLKTWVE